MVEDRRTKLTDIEEKKIIADYIETNNYSEVARINGVSVNTVRRVIERQDSDELEKKVKQKKKENTISTLEYMDKQHETKKRVLDKLLKGIELKADDIKNIDKMNIKDLATAYGIILDKELKLKEINQKLNENTSFENINAMITNIATLINSPVSNRTEDNIDE